MKVSIAIDYAGNYEESARRVATLERAGLDMVWIAEAYGFDAATYMGYLAATTTTVEICAGILPIYTRTPTLIAMTAAGLDALSGGRAVLGLGASGPQVIEGWHGVRYDKPLLRTREIVEICRAVWQRDAKLEHQGKAYTLPLPPERGTGLGKPLKIINHPVRSDIPIYIAALGEKNVEMTAEIADGWLPLFFVPEKAKEVFGPALDAGFARRAPELGALDIAAGGIVAIGDEDDVAAVRDLARPEIALYVGGMGARGQNFYNALVRRYGYEAEAEEIQDLYLAGKKDEAAAKVPDELLRLTSLCGPEAYIKDRIAAFKEAGVTVLKVTPIGPNSAETIAKLKEWSA